MRALLPSLALGLVALLGAGTAQAGVTITVEETGPSQGPKSNSLLLEHDRMAMATHAGRMIFRDDLQTAWMVNDGRRSYFELNAESMQQAQSAMQQAMQQMQAKLRSMPAEQRKQVEAMMAAQGMPASPGESADLPSISYHRLDRRMTVGSWSCEMFEQQVAGRRLAAFCAARLDAVGLANGDLKAFQDYFTFTQKALPAAARRRAAMVDFAALSKAAGYDAIPLDVAVYDDDKLVSHNVVRSIERGDIPPATFELPAGYRKQEIGKPAAGQD